MKLVLTLTLTTMWPAATRTALEAAEPDTYPRPALTQSHIQLSCCRHHSDRCAAIHLNMCVAQPTYYNPLHILQGLNALLLPQLPLLLTSTEIQRVQVGGHQQEGTCPSLDLTHNKRQGRGHRISTLSVVRGSCSC